MMKQAKHPPAWPDLSHKHESSYQQHVAEWRNLPGVVHRGLHIVYKRAMEQWVLHSQGTIAFLPPHVAENCSVLLLLTPRAPVLPTR